MKQFICYLLFSYVVLPSLYAQNKITVNKYLSNWLHHEINIIKKLPSAVKHCIKTKHCSQEDKQILKDGFKRIAGVVTVLGGLAIVSAVVYDTYCKINLTELSNEDQIDVKGQFQDAIWGEKVDDVKTLFSFYKVPSNILNKWFAKAIQGTKPEIVEIMLNNGASPSYIHMSETTGLYMTMLGAAIYRSFGNKSEINNSKQIVQSLLNHGANINATHNSGRYTALMIATEGNVPDLIKLLLHHGADTTLQNERGETAFAIAQQKGHRKSLSLLRASK